MVDQENYLSNEERKRKEEQKVSMISSSSAMGVGTQLVRKRQQKNSQSTHDLTVVPVMTPTPHLMRKRIVIMTHMMNTSMLLIMVAKALPTRTMMTRIMPKMTLNQPTIILHFNILTAKERKVTVQVLQMILHIILKHLWLDLFVSVLPIFKPASA